MKICLVLLALLAAMACGHNNDGGSYSAKKADKLSFKESLFEKIHNMKDLIHAKIASKNEKIHSKKAHKHRNSSPGADCSTVMDEVWEEQCDTKYEPSCRMEMQPHCTSIQAKECAPESQTRCSFVFEDKCKTISVPKCTIDWEKRCTSTPDCTTIEARSCTDVEKDVCVTHMDKTCTMSTVNVCRKVAVRELTPVVDTVVRTGLKASIKAKAAAHKAQKKGALANKLALKGRHKRSSGANSTQDCQAPEFSCDDGKMCLNWLKVCNGYWDCDDGTDETNEPCKEHQAELLKAGQDYEDDVAKGAYDDLDYDYETPEDDENCDTECRREIRLKRCIQYNENEKDVHQALTSDALVKRRHVQSWFTGDLEVAYPMPPPLKLQDCKLHEPTPKADLAQELLEQLQVLREKNELLEKENGRFKWKKAISEVSKGGKADDQTTAGNQTTDTGNQTTDAGNQTTDAGNETTDAGGDQTDHNLQKREANEQDENLKGDISGDQTAYLAAKSFHASKGNKGHIAAKSADFKGRLETFKAGFRSAKAQYHEAKAQFKATTKALIHAKFNKGANGFKAAVPTIKVRYEKSCQDEPRKICTQTPRQDCHKEVVPLCKSEPRETCVLKEKCKSWPSKNCGMVNKETCLPFPTKKCTQVSTPVCRIVPRQECTEKKHEICETVPTKDCQKVLVSQPRTVCIPRPTTRTIEDW